MVLEAISLSDQICMYLIEGGSQTSEKYRNEILDHNVFPCADATGSEEKTFHISSFFIRITRKCCAHNKCTVQIYPILEYVFN